MPDFDRRRTSNLSFSTDTRLLESEVRSSTRIIVRTRIQDLRSREIDEIARHSFTMWKESTSLPAKTTER